MSASTQSQNLGCVYTSRYVEPDQFFELNLFLRIENQKFWNENLKTSGWDWLFFNYKSYLKSR
jgi:hypothetical protein